MNLTAERLHILKALAHEADTGLLHDLSLPGQVRRLFSDLEGGDDAQRKGRVRQLSTLYDQHGPALLRCVLEYAFLLHTTSEAGDIFGGLLTKLEADLKAQPWLGPALLNELSRHARAPYDSTRRLVDLILKRGGSVPGFLARLVENQRADFALRSAAAAELVVREDTAGYPSILHFLVETSRSPLKEVFLTGFLPLAELFARTGPDGLKLAVAAFERGELGPHGPMMLAAFEDDFHGWFLKHTPEPSREWARVLMRAWFRARRVQSRDRMLSLLVDDWCARPALAGYISEGLRRVLRGNPNYLAPASQDLRERVRGFVGSGAADDAGEVEERILKEAAGTEAGWRKFAAWRPTDKVEGRAAAAACSKAGKVAQKRIIEWLRGSKNPRFLSGAFDRLFEPAAFAALPVEAQTALLDIPELPGSTTSEQLEKLLESKLAEEVRSRVQTALLVILQQHPDQRQREAGGLS